VSDQSQKPIVPPIGKWSEPVFLKFASILDTWSAIDQ
jgi:hypothetical protein